MRHGRCGSLNGSYGTSTKACHFALIFAALITLPHFSVSSAMSLPKSAGEPAITVPPRSLSCVLILGSARPALISLLSLSTISVGVLGCAQVEPNARLKARHELAHCREVWQYVRARRGRHRQRPQLAGPDVLDRRDRGDKGHLDLAGDEIGSAGAPPR